MSDGNVERPSRQGRLPCYTAWTAALFAVLILLPGISFSQTAPSRIVVGGDVTYPPFEWLDEGAERGLNVDLINQAARLGGSEVEFHFGTWPDPFQALERGDLDVLALFPSAKLNSELLFTAPFYYVNYAIYAAPYARPVENLEDLVGQRVAIELRSPLELELQRAHIVQTDNVVKALQALVNDEAEYALLPTPTADRLIHHLDLPVHKVLASAGSSAFSFTVHRSRPELFNWLQNNLERMVASGRFEAIQKQWHDQMEFTPRRDYSQLWNLIALGAITILLLMVTAAFAWSWRLRQRVMLHAEQLIQAQAEESEARYHANYDSITDLPKEHEFVRQVEEMLKTKSPNAVQELRLIKFMAVNEAIKLLGRDHAEQLLRRFADSVRHVAQGKPCGYLGRGVYALCQEAQAMPRIFETLVSHWSNNDEKLYAQISGGSAYWPEDGRNTADLIQKAETALNVSRADGKRWAAYSSDMEPESDDLEMVSLFRADELEGLTVVYQPQVDLRRGNVVAAEALARWSHPTLGTVAPSRFIPLIEKAGLVSQVTSRMLDNAARLSARLRAEGLPSSISVNITISDLMEGNLPSQVEQTLARHGAVASDLTLELTEPSVASDLKSATDVLHRLHDVGVLLSVDDFGTGYSSLSYLSAFPIHEVKIDRNFVFDMVRNPRNRSIVRSTILMAGELGLETVAEGAEDRVTLELLTEYNCNRVQGYVYSPPLDESAFLEFVRTYGNGGLV